MTCREDRLTDRFDYKVLSSELAAIYVVLFTITLRVYSSDSLFVTASVFTCLQFNSPHYIVILPPSPLHRDKDVRREPLHVQLGPLHPEDVAV